MSGTCRCGQHRANRGHKIPINYGMICIPFVSYAWSELSMNASLASKLSEYHKLAEMVVVHVMGSCAFHSCKSKLRNHLVDHLALTVMIFAQPLFCIDTLPYPWRILHMGKTSRNCMLSLLASGVRHMRSLNYLGWWLGGCTVYYVWEPRAFVTPPKNPMVYERLYV